ncbi:MAG: ArnT family glycosyltransferase [Hyphomonadaceae bacterium]
MTGGMAAAAPSLLDQAARGWRGYVLIALIALASSLFGAARLPVMDRDEARFAQATRQMVETGDYVRIRVQQDERNKKPIGIHWLQAAAVHAAAPITQADNVIWPYRLPSAFGIVLAALAALWGGTALVGRRAAFLGAALFAAGALAGFEGMTAKTDAVLCGFTTLALAALARLRIEDARPKLLALLFWFAIGAGVLIKGPVTPMVAGLALGALFVWEKRAAWMRPLSWWPGPLLAVAMVLPWMIAIGAATEGRFFAEALGEDLAPKIGGGAEGHFAWPGTHLILLPLLIFPATYVLPLAARLGWRAAHTARSDESMAPIRFLLACIVPAFLAFELLPTKLAHYTLPTFPAIALLGAAALEMAEREGWRVWRIAGYFMAALAGGLLVAVLAYGATFMPGDSASDLRRAATMGLVGGLVLLGALAAVLLTKQNLFKVGALCLCALLLSFGLRSRVLPEAHTLLISTEAVAALTRARLLPRADRPLWVVGYRETSLVFMTDTAIRLATAEEFGAGAEIGQAGLIEAREFSAVRAALAERGLAFAASGVPVSGLNVGNGDRVTLYPGEVQTAPPPPPDFNGELAGDPPPDPEPPPRPRRRAGR